MYQSIKQLLYGIYFLTQLKVMKENNQILEYKLEPEFDDKLHIHIKPIKPIEEIDIKFIIEK